MSKIKNFGFTISIPDKLGNNWKTCANDIYSAIKNYLKSKNKYLKLKKTNTNSTSTTVLIIKGEDFQAGYFKISRLDSFNVKKRKENKLEYMQSFSSIMVSFNLSQFKFLPYEEWKTTQLRDEIFSIIKNRYRPQIIKEVA